MGGFSFSSLHDCGTVFLLTKIMIFVVLIHKFILVSYEHLKIYIIFFVNILTKKSIIKLYIYI